MAIKVLMPKLGLTMTEGTIEEWKFHEGDAVKKGDILFSVATDKLTNDVEAENDGTLLKILLPEGETAECSAVVAYLGAAGESVPDGGNDAAVSTSAQVSTPAPAEPVRSAPAAEKQAAELVSAGRIRVSPYARKTAKELGVDLTALAGTGPNGRIIWRDVDAAAKEKKEEPAAAAGICTAAGLYTSANVTELLHAVELLKGAMTAEQFVEKASAKLDSAVAVRHFGGVEGALPTLHAGETAVLGFGDAMDGRLRLNLAYAPSAMDDAGAAEYLRSLAALLETPLSLLV